MNGMEYDPDGQFCSECGIDYEVIGPPGPTHKSHCSKWVDREKELAKLSLEPQVIGFVNGDLFHPIIKDPKTGLIWTQKIPRKF